MLEQLKRIGLSILGGVCLIPLLLVMLLFTQISDSDREVAWPDEVVEI